MVPIDQPFESTEPLNSAAAAAQAAEEVARLLLADVTLPEGDIPLTLVLRQAPDFEVIHKPLPRAESDYLKLALFIYVEIVVAGAPAAALLAPVRESVPGDLATLLRAQSVLALPGEDEMVVLNARDRFGRTVERAALIERSLDAPPRYLPFLGSPDHDGPATANPEAELPLPGVLDMALIDAIAVAAKNGPDRQFVVWLHEGGNPDDVPPAVRCPCGSSKKFEHCHRGWYPLGLAPA